MIVFSSARIGSSFNHPAFDLVSLDPNTAQLQWLTGVDGLLNSSPSWSPDGKKILFVKDSLLYTIDRDGSNEAKVESPFGSSLSHPSWSSTGLYMVSYETPGKYPQLWQARVGQSDWSTMTPEISFQFNPVWSPDGKDYSFAGSPGKIYTRWFDFWFGGFRLTAYDIPQRDIYLVNAESGEMTPLDKAPEDGFDPAWSPDGQKLAFVSVLDQKNPEIFVINRDGTGLTRLTNNDSEDVHPTWSPDGSMLAFSSDRDGNFEIYIMSATGQSQVRLTDNLMDDVEPVWSPADPENVPVGPKFGLRSLIIKPHTLESVVEDLVTAGLLTSSSGQKINIPDFDRKWAQINWYSYYLVTRSVPDFVVRADASWESASDKANWFNSGCGFVFREKDVDNHYLVYLGMDGIARLGRVRGGQSKDIGTAERYPVVTPKDSANLMLTVQGNRIQFFVNGLLLLQKDDTALTEGNFGLTLVSGTNKDFGTACKMENIELWKLK